MNKRFKFLLKKFHLLSSAQIVKYYLLNIKKILNTFLYLFVNYFKIKKQLKIILDSQYSIFLNHNYGGGTANFSKVFISKITQLVTVTNKNNEKNFLYSCNYKNFEIQITQHQLNLLFLKADKIYVNSLYSFSRWKSILLYLIKSKKINPHNYIEYMVHDYHCICPNLNLIYENNYCDIECNSKKCKFIYRNDYVKSIKKWRYYWNLFFKNIDSIRCFSSSSYQYLSQIYPAIKTKISIIPHDMSYCKNTKIENIDSEPFKLGIVGNINNAAKGLYILDFLADKFELYNENIHIFGTKVEDIQNSLLIHKNEFFYGPYKNFELKNILQKNKISIVAFISICPETFSYLISELILLEIPIVCFDIGAQSEKIRRYKKGYIVQSKEEMVDFLLKKKGGLL